MQFPPLRPPPVSSQELADVFQRAGFVVRETHDDRLVLQNRDRVVLVRRGHVHPAEETERLLVAAKMETREFLRRLKSYRRNASEEQDASRTAASCEPWLLRALGDS